ETAAPHVRAFGSRMTRNGAKNTKRKCEDAIGKTRNESTKARYEVARSALGKTRSEWAADAAPGSGRAARNASPALGAEGHAAMACGLRRAAASGVPRGQPPLGGEREGRSPLAPPPTTKVVGARGSAPLGLTKPAS